MNNSRCRETVIQFGEGGFLRSFVDKFFDILNKSGLYDGKVVVVQPIPEGLCDTLNAQRGVYNLFLRGIEGGREVCEQTEIHSISRAINPYTDYDAYLALAENPDMRVITSNTTEAGIEYLGVEKLDDKPPKSFPAKLTALLWRRYQLGLPGFIILSCELIDRNGDALRDCVVKYCDLWRLGDGFCEWIEKENHFCSTLVDRICTGYPKEESERAELSALCPGDKLIDTAEIFHLWVIEGDFEDELPFKKAGINVVWTDNVDPYKKRKVRILNGAHTSMVLAAYLYGLRTVGECMRDKTTRAFLEAVVLGEILPTIGDTDDNREFAKAVFERFENPYIKHMLLSIALNSVSKFKVRVLPTMLEYREKFGKNPKALCFSIAALAAFYKKGEPNDSPEIMEFMKSASFHDILAATELWDRDITCFEETAAPFYETIMNKPAEEWFKCVL